MYFWNLFLGWKSDTASGAIDLNKVWGALRIAIIAWLTMKGYMTCEHALVEQVPIVHAVFDQCSKNYIKDMSFWVSVIIGIVELIRRLAKDYTDRDTPQPDVPADEDTGIDTDPSSPFAE